MEESLSKENPLVSVIIPTHNGQNVLAYALESILVQTYKHMEIVIIDDGSTDRTGAVISQYAKKEPRITCLKNECNVGFVKSLNKGIAAAHGKYIARLDDDDTWIDPRKLEKQIGFLEENPDYVLVGGGLIRINSKGQERMRYLFFQEDRDIRKSILIESLFTHSSVVFRKDAFDKVDGYNEKFGFFADQDLWLKLGMVGKLYNFPEYFTQYLDKEEDDSQYVARNNDIRRKLKLNITLRKSYSHFYSGFYKSIVLYLASYMYSYLPSRQKLRWIMLKARTLIIGRPPYTYQ